MPDLNAALLLLNLPADHGAAREARDGLAPCLSGAVSEDCADVIVLLASELVTNAVLHARSGPTVTLWVETASVRVEVADQSPALPRLRHYSALSTTGRGMRLLEHLATRWGVLPSQVGKTVWFELDTHTSPEAAEAAFIFDVDVEASGL